MPVFGGSKKLKLAYCMKLKLAYCMKYELTVFQGGSKKNSYTLQKIVSVCLAGGLKTETGILHEILTDIKSQISQQLLVLQGKNVYILVDI